MTTETEKVYIKIIQRDRMNLQKLNEELNALKIEFEEREDVMNLKQKIKSVSESIPETENLLKEIYLERNAANPDQKTFLGGVVKTFKGKTTCQITDESKAVGWAIDNKFPAYLLPNIKEFQKLAESTAQAMNADFLEYITSEERKQAQIMKDLSGVVAELEE